MSAGSADYYYYSHYFYSLSNTLIRHGPLTVYGPKLVPAVSPDPSNPPFWATSNNVWNTKTVPMFQQLLPYLFCLV